MTHRFDDFSKSLAGTTVPRRQSLRLFGVAVAGALLGPLGLRTASAQSGDPCKAFCDQCPTRSQRTQCQKYCRWCSGYGGRLCGSCGGSGGYVCCESFAPDCCGPVCRNLSNDIYNCGACGNVCEDRGIYWSLACVSGVCSYYECGPWIDLMNDNSNCGRCGNVCPNGTACSFGNCEAVGGNGSGI